MLRKLTYRGLRSFSRVLFSSKNNSSQIKANVKVIEKADCQEQLKGLYQNQEHLQDIIKAKSIWKYTEESEASNTLYLISAKETEEEEVKKDNGSLERGLGVSASKLLNDKKVKESFLSFSESIQEEGKAQFVNSMILSNYSSSRKTEDKKKLTLQSIFFENSSEKLKFYQQSAKSTNFARSVLNKPGSEATPEEMSKIIRKLIEEANSSKLEFQEIVGQNLQKEGMNCHYAVGKGASSAPRLVVVRYKGAQSPDESDLAIVGKGVTFDTGGLNIKPTNYIENMYLDKGGACATLGALRGCIKLSLKVNALFAFSLAENAVDANSFKPSDILTSLKGKTVEVGNTDAQGRLCLIDTMTYIQRKYKVSHLIDLATLTGACVIALGDHTAGLFSNDEEFVREIISLGKEVNESFWQLPILPEHHEAIKGKIADLSNSGGRYGGASTAAAFLQNFVQEGVKWAHFDIAGPGMAKTEKMPTYCYGGTGFGTQTLLNFLRRRQGGN